MKNRSAEVATKDIRDQISNTTGIHLSTIQFAVSGKQASFLLFYMNLIPLNWNFWGKMGIRPTNS